ncbi:hypothetical protein CC85DRAFT_95909 [Cutaneotrichosporon oleaginosum]|uniref:Uncharacterized protein n=1 Tax=Cutaneotrichosporon oleaginosum TaxID=879819 RepID=A0A0J0XMG6_9TREE|nr:uncharacterized protein CC85DRAFT_95909 [Cutaneotrichosporon oleaginosum]KLT42306.1 hypothetical protein CC85DRAFT_95909 [Cutaneotrichosporon oleaginosum]TXT11478.1 hypothetical protein COLE_01888 [Cutaneotrichosporon oleaginosum]
MGWFRRVRGKSPKAPASEPAIPTHIRQESIDLVEINQADVEGYSEDSARQAPYAPSGQRMATLHLSPSETNLYLQALAGLDKVNPNLPLWSEPAPALPSLSIDPQPLPAPHIPYPTTPDIIPALHPNRQNRQHGLLVLSGDSSVQITGFPAIVVADLDAALQTWKPGVASRSEDLDYVAKRHSEMPVCWKAELRGKVWRLKGTQELESIRLLLAIFTALARHGFTMVGGIQPATSKPESHNLLFTYTPDIEEIPPLFFAVSLPLPDRISLINPPLRLSGQLLSSIRSSITSLHRPLPQPTLSHFKAIKLEGWVHPGVYRFWLAGLRRWPAGAGGVKRDVVARLHPLLVLGIADAVKSLKFAFVGSVPLLPRAAARDVLVFSSTPESQLCYRDAYSEESERNRLSALIRSASARSRQGSSDDRTNSSSDRHATSLINRPHPIQSRSRSGGSYTSTDFYPGAHSSSPAVPPKPSVHRLQTQASYDESAFSRPSARTSLERERRTSIDQASNDSRRPSMATEPPLVPEKGRLNTTTPKTAPKPLRMFAVDSPSPPMSPVGSPTSPTTSGSPQISYNDFLYHPLGNGPRSVRTTSGNLSMTATASPSHHLPPRHLSGGAMMAYPPLSPGHAAERAEGHIPLLSIDTDSISTRSRYSSDSPRPQAVDDWSPDPPSTIKSPVSDISSAFVTPPSSPDTFARSRSPNPYAVSGTPPSMARGGIFPTSAPAPVSVPSRSPHRMPPIAAAHHSGASNGDHADTIRGMGRDRAAALSRTSMKSQDSYVSAASSRPPGMGSTRTRIHLSMSK